MARTAQQEALADFDYAVSFPGSRAHAAFALVRANGDALTVAEVHEHSGVSQTTIRKALAGLVETGIAEETSKHGRLAFRMTPKGQLGHQTWQREQEAVAEAAERRPQSTALLYRWRVSGYASRPAAVDRDEIASAVAGAGAQLVGIGSAQHYVELTYEVDAADEQAALAAIQPVGWTMMGMVSRATRLGLASGLPLRPGHELRFADGDPAEVVTALERGLAAEIATLKDVGVLPSSWEGHSAAVATIADFLAFVELPEDRRLPLPDDARLLDAIAQAWSLLEDAGVRAVGPAFEISERDVRARYASAGERFGDPPEGTTWEEICEQILEGHRRQGRLVP